MNIGLGIGIPFTRSSLWASIFTPSALFLDGSTQGVWYDPSDINLTWRRNLLTYSEQFDNAAWTKFNSGVVTPNAAVAPDESTTADFITSPGTGGAFQMLPLISGVQYSVSAWVKSAGTGSQIQLYGQGGIFRSAVLSLTDTWTRHSFSFIATSSGSVDNGVTATINAYIWGAQLEQGSTATPYQRITDGIQDYLQYQAQPVLYRDAAGTLPVTAVEQPVGLMLDKSKGLVLGPELVTNGDFSSGSTGWTAGAGWVVSSGAAVATASSAALSQGAVFTTGKWYKISFQQTFDTGSLQLRIAGAQSIGYFNSTGIITTYVYATTSGALEFNGTSLTSTIDNISVRELPGNHAFNPSGNSANSPVLSARYNLLTKTEQFDDAVWGTSDVTVSANKLIPTTANSQHYIGQGSATLGVTHTITVRAKQAGYSWLKLVAFDQYANFDLANGVVGTNYSGVSRTISAVGDGSYICTFTFTSTSAASNQGCIIKVGTADNASWDSANYSGNGVDGIQVYYADLRVANNGINLPSYQRVNTATDYDTVGFPLSLRFNGVNQWLQTNSIDFSYSDKMFVCAGVRKLSDAVATTLLELSVTSDSNTGSFYLRAPDAGYPYGFKSRGTANAWAQTSSTYSAPITNVISGIGDISGDQSILRINGTQAAISTTDQGTGNYGNYPLYIGARAGSSLWFNGRLYQLVITAGSEIRVAEEDSDLFLSESGDFITAETTVAVIQSAIEQTEAFVNRKTSAF